jgi:hypothetical protein
MARSNADLIRPIYDEWGRGERALEWLRDAGAGVLPYSLRAT